MESEPRCNSLSTACQDFFLAVECENVEQCIPRWETLETPVGNDTELCATCKKMVQEARDNLLSNMTQDELRQVLEGSCDELMPFRPFNGMVSSIARFLLVDNYTVLDELASGTFTQSHV